MQIYRLRVLLLIVVAVTIISVSIRGLNVRSNADSNPRAVASSEDEVYEAVVRDLYIPHKNNSTDGAKRLVFVNTVDTFLCAGVQENVCADAIRKRLRGAADGSIRSETIEDFISRSRTQGPLSNTFHTDLPRDFVASDAVYLDIVPVEKGNARPFNELFPEAGGLISFSHAGFDHSLNEAIVSTSFICGGLCGTGRRYVLRKKWGKWEVIDKWVVWAS